MMEKQSLKKLALKKEVLSDLKKSKILGGEDAPPIDKTKMTQGRTTCC